MSDPINVHVIDDDDSARESLVFLLDCAGFAPRSYASAEHFLEAAPALTSAVVISDVRMPGMSGVDLVRHLKQQGAEAPVIVITGHADVPLAIQAMKAGVSDFIEKPFDDDTLLSAVRSAFRTLTERHALERERDAINARLATLSGREREVLDRLVEGLPNKTIAYDLQISARTVEVYRSNVMTKMGANSLSDLVKMAVISRITS